MSGALDARLLRLKTELDDHARIARYLGLDFERPIQSLGDGYPENAISWVGKITEKLLKQLWRHHNVEGSPAGRTLRDLITGCRPHIRSHNVIEALRDIQRLRNRSAHDGYIVADEDGLTAVRRLLDILAWYTSTGSGALSGDAPRLAPAVASKAEFLAGLYVTLDFRLGNRTELSQHTVYQLFVRERGLRTEYVELLLSKDAGDVAQVLEVTGGELLQTSLPKLTRFLILEDQGGQIPELLQEDCRVVTYDHFMDTLVDLDRHIADVAGLYPRLDAGMVPVAGDLLSADERSGEMRITEAGAAGEGRGQRREPADRGPAGDREDDVAQAAGSCGASGGGTPVPVLLRSEPEERGAVRGLRDQDAGAVHVGGDGVRVPGVLLRPDRVGVVHPGRG